MLLSNRPAHKMIEQFIALQAKLNYSYALIGMTRAGTYKNFKLDHNRIRLGAGARCYQKAVAAMNRWQMFNIGWVELYQRTTPIMPGNTVAVLVDHKFCWSLNACKIVYTIATENIETEQYGFAYGTLPDHGEMGEERFSIEWHKNDNSVWYDILALSKPRHLLAKLGYPLTRYFQKKFASDSKTAMFNDVNG
jgi:uncharacterized protein (UPF0548 family)